MIPTLNSQLAPIFPSCQSAKCHVFLKNQSEFNFISEVSGQFEITGDTPMFVKLSFGDEADT